MALKNLESGTQVIWTTMKIPLWYLEFDSHWVITELPSGTVRPSKKVMGLVNFREIPGTGGQSRRDSFIHIVV